MAVNPLDAFAQGQGLVNSFTTQLGRRQAAQGLASGNYAQALSALGGMGDIGGVIQVQSAQAQGQERQRAREEADLGRQISFSRQATRALEGALTSGQDPVAAFDGMVPAFQALGATPQQVQTYRQALVANPAGFVQQIKQLTDTAARELEIQNLGNGYGVAIDKTTGEVVNEYQAPQRPVNVGNVLIDPETGQVILDAREPKYQTIQNTDGSTSVVAIDQPAPRGGASGGGQPRGIRNNNPGNIEDGPFARSLPGYAGSDGRFARFNTMQDGISAGGRLLDSYASRGFVTPAQVINRWAPPSDGNPTQAYAQYVARRLGIGVNDPIPANRRAEAFQAINDFENGNRSASNGQPSSGGGPRVVAQGENRGLTPAQQLAEQRFQQGEDRNRRQTGRQLRTEFEGRAEVKDFRTVEASYRQIQAQASGDPNGMDDIALTFAFMKMLDPGSVVREGEYALVGRGAGLSQQVIAALQRVDSGESLTPEMRRRLVAAAERVYESRRQTYQAIEQQYRGYAQEDGIDPNRIVPQRPSSSPSTPRLRFQPTEAQTRRSQQIVPGTPGNRQRATRGSAQNPILINPADPRTSFANVPRGAYFITPAGELKGPKP